jgi:hypothetical protein
MDNDRLFASANTALSRGYPDAALAGYNALAKKGVMSANLYNNTGVAYARAHQWAPAYLNFEKGKQIEPLDEQLAHNAAKVLENLDTATRKNNSGFDAAGSAFFKRYTEVNQMATPLFLVGILLFVLAGKSKVALQKTARILLVIFMGLVTLLWCSAGAQRSGRYMLTLRPRTVLRSGPSALSGIEMSVGQAYQIKYIAYYKGWYEVADFNKRRGWVAQSDLAEIN